MRMYLCLLFCSLSFLSFAQVSGDIEKDTVLANQHYAAATQLAKENPYSNEIVVLLEKAVALYNVHPFDEKTIAIKVDLSIQYYNRRNSEASIILAEEIISLLEEKIPSRLNDPILINIYKILYLSYRSSDPKKCIKYSLMALDCMDENNEQYFKIAGDLLLTYTNYSKLEETKALLLDLENIINNQKDGKLDKYWLIIYNGKIRLYETSGDYEQAILYSKKLFTDNEIHQVYTTNQLAPTYMKMGIFLSHINEYEEALEWANKGLDIGKKSSNKLVTGSFYSTFAYICALQKKHQKTLENHEISITYFLSDSVRYAGRLQNAYRNVAVVQNELKQYKKAVKSIEKSKMYGLNPNQGNTLGVSLAALGKYEAALKELQSSVIQYSTQFDDEDINKNPSVYEVFNNPKTAINTLSIKGRTWYDWGKKEKDKTKLLNSYNTFKVVFSHYESSLKTKKGFDKTMFKLNIGLISTLDYMIKVQAELYESETKQEIFDELLYLTERRKALQLIETLSPSPLPEDILNKEQSLLKKLSHNGQKLDLATNKNQKDSILFYQNALFETNQVLEKHLEMVKNNYPKESNDFYNTEYVTLEEIKTKLPESTLLIEYNIIENDGFIIAISPSNQKIVPVDFKSLKDNIKKLSELIQDRFAFQKAVRDEFINVSHELYNTLIKPIESELEGKTKLMIVVEKQLFHLPFELLLKTNEKKPYHELDFLIKKYEANYHYSATAFLKLKNKPTVLDNSLLAFAPVFTKGKELNEATRSLDFMIDRSYYSIDNHKFIALPNTKKEVTKIAEIVTSNNGQAKILLSKDATKINLSNQLENQSYQFMHLATHGLVNFKNPKLSALACYSNNAKMDNLLYANEIQFKNINADLVVLSSCESGIGQLVAGEGLIALNRSFIYSGAKNVMFSLWKVSDKYSSELMIDFYGHYFKTKSYTTALHHSKLKMLENPTTAQPKFWAAFILMGE